LPNLGTKFICANTLLRPQINLTNEKFCFSTKKTDVKMYRECYIHRYYIDNDVEEYIQQEHKKAVIQENEKKTFLVCQQIS